ncbi:MAG: hypothetical protein ACERKN_12835 [Velocimicrobium sp.]
MKIEEQLMTYKVAVRMKPNEEKIQQTIQKSKETFLLAEQSKLLTFYEFLLTQLKLIRKRWWFLQILLLFILWETIIFSDENIYVIRSMGVLASLFVILMIPELWKNRTSNSIEIESTSYYSLKQIYATRMLLFGIVDIFYITIFCGMASAIFHFTAIELIVQFLLPMTVTACICLGFLCSRHLMNEVLTITFCMIWCAVWSFIILNNSLYIMIAVPIWLGLFVVALAFICVCIYRILNFCIEYWEEPIYGINIE